MLSLTIFALPRAGNDKCYDIYSNGVQVGVFEEQNDSDAKPIALSESDSNSDTSNEAVNDALEALERNRKTGIRASDHTAEHSYSSSDVSGSVSR